MPAVSREDDNHWEWLAGELSQPIFLVAVQFVPIL